MSAKIMNAYRSLIHFGETLQSPILFLCRLYWGWLFAEAGWEKLNGISHFSQLLSTYHFPATNFLAHFVGSCELIGGICLLLGFASRLAAIPLIFIMFTAYSTIHVESLRAIFHTPSLFVSEAPFNFLLTSLLVLAFGPGCISLDYLMQMWVKDEGLKGS